MVTARPQNNICCFNCIALGEVVCTKLRSHRALLQGSARKQQHQRHVCIKKERHTPQTRHMSLPPLVFRAKEKIAFLAATNKSSCTISAKRNVVVWRPWRRRCFFYSTRYNLLSFGHLLVCCPLSDFWEWNINISWYSFSILPSIHFRIKGFEHMQRYCTYT